MKLFPLDQTSRLVSNIRKVSRKLRISVLNQEAVDLGDIIIIGNGTPDDIAVAVIAHHLNGDRIVGIVKPRQRKGLSVIEIIPTYIRQSPHTDHLVIIIDQDDNNLDDLFKQCNEKMRTSGIQINGEMRENQLKIYECEHVNKIFTIILVINGLREITVRKHAIEDHLLKVAIDSGLIQEINEELESSKEIWKQLEQNQRDDVFKLLKQIRTIRDAFPQQFIGCKYLKEL